MHERWFTELDDVDHSSLGVRFCREKYDWDNELLNKLASGRYPKTAEHRTVDARAEPDRHPVDCTVFAPDWVGRKQTVFLQVFLHAPEDRERAEATARNFESGTEARGHRSLVLDAPIGTIFAFGVEIEGFVSQTARTDWLLWSGRPQSASFRFQVPKGCSWGQHIGTVWISMDGTPVGRINFQIEVIRYAHAAPKKPVANEARHYRTCLLLLIAGPG
jgi:hypothetical protein